MLSFKKIISFVFIVHPNTSCGVYGINEYNEGYPEMSSEEEEFNSIEVIYKTVQGLIFLILYIGSLQGDRNNKVCENKVEVLITH